MDLSDPGRIAGTSRPVEDSFFELLIDTLEGLDRPARGLFVQRLLKSLTQLDLNEAQSLESWERILERRRELTQLIGRPVALKTAMVDYLASSNLLRAPILMEYEDLKKLQVNAATDPLTGLYNRRLFEEYFEKELNRARRYDLNLALIVMDLHVFKMVNDRFGHPRGDQVLQLAASTLRHSMRTSDFAFRIGGDEFALLLPQSDAEHAATLGRRVHANFAGILQPQQMDIPIGLDYGLAVYPQDGDQAEVLLRVADERLYQMKYSVREKNGGAVPSGDDAMRRRTPRVTSQSAADVSDESQTSVKPGILETPGPKAPEQKPPEQKATAPAEHAANPTVTPTKPEGKPTATQGPTQPPVTSGPVTPERSGTERRRWERISLSGKRAFATVGSGADKQFRVLDMSHGGVALEAEHDLPSGETFQAILHVPILGEVRVKLKKLYVQRTFGQQSRVGCLFVT
jgi:diguanylate cyclase (GGDEF)-like protein